MEDIFLTDCAAGKFSTTFEAKAPIQARVLHTFDTQPLDIEQVVAKALENMRQLTTCVS